MKNSGISSATTTRPSHAESTRRGFALTGRSTLLDPRTHAIRPDLADVRLADRIFAPHYAAPVSHVVTSAAVLRTERSPDSDRLADLAEGDQFELLDLVGGDAWGIAVQQGLVGYCAASHLAPA